MECETIMPLALANKNTRIVLAGDHMQVRASRLPNAELSLYSMIFPPENICYVMFVCLMNLSGPPYCSILMPHNLEHILQNLLEVGKSYFVVRSKTLRE